MRLCEIFQRPGSTTNTVSFVVICFAIASSSWASQKKEARVTQVIQDVKLLPGGAAPRPAAVNDDVREGTAVRTGQDSRTELTFSDQTLTRLGANSVFSFNTGDRAFDLGQGAILMSVPPNGSSVKVKTAAVTAAITGGTAIFGAGPPTKFMVLEGIGTVYPTGHPELAITLHGGEMVTLLDGKLVKQEFNVKLVLETSELIVPFEDLPNLALIWDIVFEQEGDGTQPANHQYDDIDERDQSIAASQGAPGGPSGKFGAPLTIGSPNPYQINSGTEIQTDPTITTNGVTDLGTIYRDVATDGPPSEWFFGSTTAFDTALGFDDGSFIGSPGLEFIAAFKFQSLQLTGDPTVIIGEGAPVDLALIGVDGISSGGPGGPLTFSDVDDLLLFTQAGPINLGSEISFENIGHLTFYARGTGSNLTLASPISVNGEINLFAEGTIQINGDENAMDFRTFSGGDFLAGTGEVMATDITIQSLSNVNIDMNQFPNLEEGGGSMVLTATNTLNITLAPGGKGFFFSRDLLTAAATTINVFSGFVEGTNTFYFRGTELHFNAGTGGIQATSVFFDHSEPSEPSTFTSAGSINAAGIIGFDSLSAGTTINVTNLLEAAFVTAGTVSPPGDVTAGTVRILDLVAPTGTLTETSGGILPFSDDPTAQHTFDVFTVNAPNGIDFSGDQFGFGAPGGILTINADNLTFEQTGSVAFANFNGADEFFFAPSPVGSGGTFVVDADNNIIANNGADITATTGLVFSEGFQGDGGSVTLHSTGGMVTVNNTIEVSSDHSEGKAQRQSASGGNITLQSDLESGLGITVGPTAQLLSELNESAPGPGGTILLSTMGANITVAPGAVIQADFGTITMDQNDPPGAFISIEGATLISETLNIDAGWDLNIGLTTPAVLNAVSISLTALNDLTWSGQTSDKTAIDSDGNVNISAGNNLSILNDLTISRTNGGRTSGLDITLDAGTDLTVGGNLSITTDASNILTGGNITVTSGGDMSIGGYVYLRTFGISGTATGTGGSIDVTVGGELTASYLDFIVDYNVYDVTVADGANLTLNVTGNLTTFQAGVGMIIYTPIADTLTSGGNLTMTVGGNLTTADAQEADVNLTVVNTVSTTVPNGANLFASVGGDLTAGQVNAQIQNDGNGGIGTGGNLTFEISGNLAASSLLVQLSNTAGGHIVDGGNITFDVGDLTTTGDAKFLLLNGGGTIDSNAVVDIGANSISVGGSLDAYIDNASGSIGPTGDGGTLQLESFGDITVTGRLNVLGTVLADDDVTVGTLSVTNLDTQGNNTIVGAGGITPFNVPGQLAPDILHTITTRLISSAGGINFNGVPADGDFSFATNAGSLTINALTITFTQGVANFLLNGFGADEIVGPVTFNGGDGSGSFPAGSGGTFTVNTTSDITVDHAIEATSGYIQPGSSPSGDGGTVNLNSTGGTVTVNNRIEVSSAEPTSSIAPFRQSATGGNIKITSGKSSGSAINISSTAQLLSMLDGAAAGPAGTIELSASGNGSSIDINNGDGIIRADQGTIDIRHNGTNAAINIASANMLADVIKIQILGSDGTLTIGGGTIDANSALHLYAAGSNGSIVFNANVSLYSASAAIIAANTVTINNGVTVFIESSNMALVYANVPNYTGSGGNGSTTGTFEGAGATTTAFPPPPPPPSASSASSSTSTVAAMSTAASSGGLTLPTTSSTSKTGSLIAKNLATAPKLAALRPVANQTTAGKTVMNPANSTELLSLLETGSEAGGKLTVAKPSARNRVAQSQTTNSTNLRRGNVVQRGLAASTSRDNVATTPAKTPVITTPVNNSVARPLATAAY